MQRRRYTEKRLHRRGHTIAVEWEAPNEQIAVEDFLENVAHIVIVNTVAAVSHTGKAALAVFNMLVDRVDKAHFVLRHLVHPVQESAGNVHGVAVFFFGAAVDDEYFHIYTFLFFFFMARSEHGNHKKRNC